MLDVLACVHSRSRNLVSRKVQGEVDSNLLSVIPHALADNHGQDLFACRFKSVVSSALLKSPRKLHDPQTDPYIRQACFA